MHPVFLSFSALSQERDRRLTVARTTLRLRKVAQPFIFQEEMREVKHVHSVFLKEVYFNRYVPLKDQGFDRLVRQRT